MSEPIILGDAQSRKVWIGGQELDIHKSLAIENKSPSGFAWGYMGSGPSQLALAILLELTDKETALRLYHSFKEAFIATVPDSADLVIPVCKVKSWLLENKECGL